MFSPRKTLYRLYRLYSGARYRFVRRLTRPGLAVLGASVVTGLLSMDISGSLSYQAFIVLLSLLGASFLCSLIFRFRFSAERILPRLATVGSPLQYRVVLRHREKTIQHGLVLMENLKDPRPNYEEFAAMQIADERRMKSFSIKHRPRPLSFEVARVNEVVVPPLLPGKETEVRFEFTPLRRGQVRFNGLTLARIDPLGLVKAFAPMKLPQSLLVLPKRYPLPSIALPGALKYQQGGVAMASNVGHSDEFISLRDYQQGDPLRHIHWRSWARTGKPIVKEFQDEFFVRHALILDTFTDHPHDEAFEEAVSVAASFACTILTQESLLDLLFVGTEAYCITAGRGLAHTEQMLEILASVRVCREKGFEALESLVLQHSSLVSGCVVVLLCWDEKRQELVRKLRTLGVPIMVLVVTDRHSTGLEAGTLTDPPENFHVLKAGSIAADLAKLGN